MNFYFFVMLWGIYYVILACIGKRRKTQPTKDIEMTEIVVDEIRKEGYNEETDKLLDEELDYEFV